MKFKVTHVYNHQLTETIIFMVTWHEFTEVLEKHDISSWTVLKVEMIPAKEDLS